MAQTTTATVEFRAVIAEGSTVVVVEERMRATVANGRSYDNDYCFVFELEGNRIRRVREYMDTLRADEMFARASTVAGQR